jgi:hypothetical protein
VGQCSTFFYGLKSGIPVTGGKVYQDNNLKTWSCTWMKVYRDDFEPELHMVVNITGLYYVPVNL